MRLRYEPASEPLHISEGWLAQVPEELHETKQDLSVHKLRLSWTRGMYQDIHEYRPTSSLLQYSRA